MQVAQRNNILLQFKKPYIKTVVSKYRKLQIIKSQVQYQKQFDKKKIKIVFTDVDGTLINSKIEVTKRVRETISKVQQKGIQVIIATGKPFSKGWYDFVGPALGDNKAGLYIQGLVIYNDRGELIYENALKDDVVRDCIKFGQDYGIASIPYSRDRTFCESTNQYTNRIIDIKEPDPEPVGDLYSIIGKLPIIKFVYSGPEQKILDVRKDLENMLGSRGVVTRALRGFWEILPPGASKGAGVQRYLDTIGLKYEDILAIGDGENDREMLQQAGVAVVMGQAEDQLKKIAHVVVPSNNEDGWAVAMEELILSK